MYVHVCAQLCPTLWGPMNCSLPGSSVHGIFQARILEWVVIFYFRVKCTDTTIDELVPWIGTTCLSIHFLKVVLSCHGAFSYCMVQKKHWNSNETGNTGRENPKQYAVTRVKVNKTESFWRTPKEIYGLHFLQLLLLTYSSFLACHLNRLA